LHKGINIMIHKPLHTPRRLAYLVLLAAPLALGTASAYAKDTPSVRSSGGKQ
jgi:hypothetical protein